MWADALLRAEQLHLLRIMAWGALTVIVGTALVIAAMMLRFDDKVVRALGLPLAALGIVDVIGAAVVYRSATLTDAAGAARLQNLTWFQLGLFAGCSIAAALIAVLAHRARMPRAAGAAIAFGIHGAALIALTAAFVPIVSR